MLLPGDLPHLTRFNLGARASVLVHMNDTLVHLEDAVLPGTVKETFGPRLL